MGGKTKKGVAFPMSTNQENVSQNCAYEYTVRRGDSFYLIAHRQGVTLRDLLAANPDIPPSRLTVGDVLCIPYGEDVQRPAGEQESGSNSGTAGSGGSTGSTDGATGDTGATGNGGTAGGDTGSSGGTTTTPTEPETPVQPETPACPPNRRTIVQEGQTAGDLQLRYGLSYHTLQDANGQVDLETIKGGDVVCIPEANVPCPLPLCVTLGENDTLESVAVTYNLPIAALLRANPCLAPEDFTAGTQIRLPN